jgi:hypothetical protein
LTAQRSYGGGLRDSGEGGFETAWRPVLGQVAAMCRAQAGHGLDADELYQRVMIRAWRGHDGFRGESSYLTWVRQIIIREASRMAAARESEVRRLVALDQAGVGGADGVNGAPGGQPDDGAADDGAAPGAGLVDVIDQAARIGAITSAEHAVLGARLRHPDDTWERLAARLGLTATGCAVAHCRAVPKLRVYLFLHRPDVLGGPEAIAAAFKQAAAGRLTAAEAEAFTLLVLQGRTDYRRRGWQTSLRGACASVAQRLGTAAAFA